MAEITRKIRLFNEAYRIAWQRLTVDGEARPATDMAVRLRDNIQSRPQRCGRNRRSDHSAYEVIERLNKRHPLSGTRATGCPVAR
jgi:hypothetical protein